MFLATAAIQLFCVALSFTLALFIYQLDRKNLINRVMSLNALVACIWTFGVFMASQSENDGRAAIWMSFSIGVALNCALMLHFALAFTKNTKLLRNPLTYIILYVPAIIVIVMRLITPNQASNLSDYASYEYYTYKWVYWLFQCWGFGVLIAAAIIILVYYIKTEDRRERSKVKFLFIAVLVATVPPIPLVTIFEAGGGVPIVITIFFSLIAYANWKYQLFPIGPEAASHNIVSTMSDSLFILDPKWNIIFVNNSALNMLKYSEKEMIEKPFEKIGNLSSKDANRVKDKLNLGEKVQTHETEFIQREGNTVYALTSFSALTDNSGEINGYVVVAVDITERKKAREKLDELQVQLREISRQAGMSEVATNILHNVGNALNSVNVSSNICLDKIKKIPTKGLTKMAQFIEDHKKSDFEEFSVEDIGKKFADYVVKLSQKINQDQEFLIQEMNDLNKSIDRVSQIVQKQQEFTGIRGVVEQINIADIVNDVLEINSAEIRDQSILIEKQLQFDGDIITEKQKLVQILINLISNAIKATQGQGNERQLTIKTDKKSERKIEIHISDNGEGIEEENLEKIFSFGFSTRESGEGFGLHISALSAQELGGKISVQSSGKNHGSTFTLELPLKTLQNQLSSEMSNSLN